MFGNFGFKSTFYCFAQTNRNLMIIERGHIGLRLILKSILIVETTKIIVVQVSTLLKKYYVIG